MDGGRIISRTPVLETREGFTLSILWLTTLSSKLQGEKPHDSTLEGARDMIMPNDSELKASGDIRRGAHFNPSGQGGDAQ